MGSIVANMFLTLDGVYQAPGGREEDPSDGFAFGGWQAPVSDDEAGETIGAEIERIDALLLGRKTYDIFAAYWPHQSGQIGDILNRVPKFVVSSTLTDPSWEGTTVLPDAAAAGRLREEYDEVHTFGSGVLIRSLIAADVLDRLHLYLYPVTLGQGKRLFAAGTIPATFRLAQPARTFPKGAVSLVYERAGEVELRDM
ncbi:dihydrofolate reductase family protein [Lacisediminihabitans sp.]|uniref:dihydrofolate reductase family protein n=1 Tax=Lacisediminihabitans sp. TaxID=2787631 RepID=UPI00374D1924